MGQKLWKIGRILLLFLCLLPLLALRTRAVDTYTLEQTKQEVYRFLTQDLGFERAVACGVMGNIDRESGFDTTASCLDTNNKTSYGLCQWNGGRFERLQSFSAERGLDYSSLEAQLLFMQHELEGDERYALSRLQGLPNTLEGAYEAGWRWARYYERCYSGYYPQRARTAVEYWLGITGGSERAVFFDATGGSCSPGVKAVSVGSAVGALPVPTRSGYNFVGWYTHAQGGERVSESTVISCASTQTFYARWNIAENFVQRLYRLCLGREADSAGLQHWTNLLNSGQMSAAEAAAGFFSSNEYKSKGVSNQAFVSALYQTLLNRQADPDGLATWTGHLQSGRSRCWVFSRICRSSEFTALCASYGLRAGSVGENAWDMGGGVAAPAPSAPATPPAPTVDAQQVRAFVTRLYNVCLGREPDAQGLENWCTHLTQHGWSGGRVAEGFVFSDEYSNRGSSNAAFVEMLYAVLLNRGPDPQGNATWTGHLQAGHSRRWVFERICDSDEFRTLCRSYGITPGV